MKLNTTIHIPEEMKRDLKSMAAKDGLTMNGAIIYAIAAYLSNKKTQQP